MAERAALWHWPRVIRFDSISLQHGQQILFVEASAALHKGEKVGLVGPNGSGKSTLFRCVMKEETPDEGQVSIDRGLTIGYFRQDVGDMAGRTVLEETLAGAGPVVDVAHELKQLEHDMGDPAKADEMDKLVERFGEVQARFDELGGYALEGKAREILAGLGFRDVGGGRRRRRALGRLEDARGAGAHSADAARRHAARRADQPPRPRVAHLARELPASATKARC